MNFAGALDADGRYEFESHSGGIQVTVPAGTGFDLEAQSFNGSLELTGASTTLGRGNQTVELAEPEIHWEMSRDGRREIDGTVGGGGRLELSTSAAT